MSLTLAILAAATATPDSVLGRWMTETRGGVVDITRCGPSICGTLVDSEHLRTNPDLRDMRNRTVALRARPLKGLRLLSGFTLKGGAWTGGTIYNADDGNTYKATVTPVDATHLKLTGCVVWPLCRTQIWTRQP